MNGRIINRKRKIHTTVQDNSGASVSWEGTDTGSTQGDGSDEDTKIHVFRNLTIVPHKASVDILAISKGRLAADQVLDTGNNLVTVVEDCVGNGGGVNGEECAVEEYIAGSEVSRGVSLVTSLVEHSVIVNDPQDLVTFTGVIPDVVIVDREVSGVPGVGVPKREDDRGGSERTKKTVEGTVEGVDEGVSGNGKMVPVKSGDGVETKTANTAGNCGQDDVIWGDPGHPVEIGHGLDDVVG